MHKNLALVLSKSREGSKLEYSGSSGKDYLRSGNKDKERTYERKGDDTRDSSPIRGFDR